MAELQPTPAPCADDADDSDDSAARARKRRAVIRRGWSNTVASSSDATVHEHRFDLAGDGGTVICEVGDGAGAEATGACVSDCAICLAGIAKVPLARTRGVALSVPGPHLEPDTAVHELAFAPSVMVAHP